MLLRLLLAALTITLLISAGVVHAAPRDASALPRQAIARHATPVPPRPTAKPPRPTATPVAGDTPVRLVIPAITLDQPLLAVGLDARQVPIVPQHNVGWYNLSARPGAGENVVLWGHVLRFKATPNILAPFARLKELAVGAQVTIYTADGQAHQYVVTEKVWATPDQVAYILPQGRELVTMVSCIGAKTVVAGSVEMSHRLITIAAPAP